VGSPSFAFGPFRVDTARRVLELDGQTIPVSGKALDILLVLMNHPGEVVDKDVLMREVWPDTAVEENNLTVNISALRKALGDPASNPRLVITVPGRGYRFAGDLSKPAARRPWTAIVAAVAIVLVCISLIAWFWREPRAREPSLLILPLRLLNPSATEEFLGAGLSDAVVTRLGSLRDLSVRPLADAAKLSGKDPYQAGREGGATMVLAGAIQQSGDRLRVNIQLLRVRDRRLIWADSFDGSTSGLFDLEDAISTRVATSLQRDLSTQRSTRNPEAYANYLRGRYYAGRYTPDGFRKGLQYLQQAIDSDPGYALAYAGLADAYYDASNLLLPPSEAMPKAKSAAQRAVGLSPDLAEAHVSLGLVASKYDWNWTEARTEFQTALTLDPNSASAHLWFGLFRAQMGDTSGAIEELRRAQQLDPLSSDANGYLSTVLYWARQYEEAARQARKTIEFDPSYAPGHISLCWTLEAQRRFAEAVAECEKGRGIAPSAWSGLALARSRALAGDRVSAQQAVDRIRSQPGEFVSGYDLAAVYAALDRPDDAFRALDDAFERRAEWMSYLKIDPQLDSLRADPRFAGLLRRMGW